MCRGEIPQTPMEAIQARGSSAARRANWSRLVTSLLCTLAVSLLVFSKLFGLGLVSGDSMHPTFEERDLVLFARMGGCGRNDVVILQAEGPLINKYVKRVVGLPGDTVDINASGNVTVNGVAPGEDYAFGITVDNGGQSYPLVLKEGEFFVLGDNREHSRDSREFGAISTEQIKGKVIAVLRTVDNP